jgi:hypothetical protein
MAKRSFGRSFGIDGTGVRRVFECERTVRSGRRRDIAGGSVEK